MSKEDIIPTYTLCIRRPDSYCGVYMYTHDIEGALRLFSDLCRKRAFNACEDARFADPWLVGEEMFIEKGEETVGHYLNSNCDNLSYEEAKALAQEHGFPLEDIWYWLK